MSLSHKETIRGVPKRHEPQVPSPVLLLQHVCGAERTLDSWMGGIGRQLNVLNLSVDTLLGLAILRAPPRLVDDRRWV